jgi:pilus assembly protein CpaC
MSGNFFSRRLVALAFALAGLCSAVTAQEIAADGSLIKRITSSSDKLEITTNTSRILTLDKKIPRVQVNNPELLSVTPLSATQIQVAAKKAGVTAVNLWDEDGNIHTVDVFIYGDVRELENALKTQFPNSSVRVFRYSNSLVLTGFIDRPDHVDTIRQLAEDYAPKVINNIQVGGVQQVLLKTKVYEVSRTKLRRMGWDVAHASVGGGYGASSVSGMISAASASTIVTNGGQTFELGLVDGADSLFLFLDALQQQNVAKIMAEPNIVAVSGRPAQFLEGGEIPILVPQSLGTTSIEYKPFGTQIDFLPIVLGDGKIRLEVRPSISDLDDSIGITLQNQRIPGFRTRRVDTAVEMIAGQTFAIAGLIQRRSESTNTGLPILSDIPVLGIPFRRTADTVNEIELLVLVTPELVDAMDPHEVPTCLPGMGTISPNNRELYCGGHVEVPNPCNNCGQQGCVPMHGHVPCCEQGAGNYGCNQGAAGVHAGPMPADQMPVNQMTAEPQGAPMHIESAPGEIVPSGAEPMHGELNLPMPGPHDSGRAQPKANSGPAYTASRQPSYQRHSAGPYKPPSAAAPAAPGGLIGPVGYDLE